MRKLLFEFEADLARTEAMCKVIIELGLLEPFNMQAKPNEGEPFTLSGMFRVVEQKINELPADKLKELVQNGALPRIYAPSGAAKSRAQDGRQSLNTRHRVNCR